MSTPPKAKRATAAKVAKPAASAAASDVTASPADRTAEDALPASEPAAAFDTSMILSVRATSQKGRWRAGRPFGPEPVELNSADLSPRELDALLTDPHLVVIDVATGLKPD